jgi:hypothetical protein
MHLIAVEPKAHTKMWSYGASDETEDKLLHGVWPSWLIMDRLFRFQRQYGQYS